MLGLRQHGGALDELLFCPLGPSCQFVGHAITFPLVGRVAVGGKTLRETETILTDLLRRDYVRRAQVSVEVKNYRSRSIFVLATQPSVVPPGPPGVPGHPSPQSWVVSPGSAPHT